MNEKSYILVTGGAGYIGSHTIISLLEKGYSPVIVDDFRNANTSVLKGLQEITKQEIPVYQIDICDLKALEVLFQKYSWKGIIHFAAYKAVGESVENPLAYYENNVGGLLTVLKLAQQYGVENFVFSSSCTVYGQPKDEIAVHEESPIALPESPYGQTKLIGEQILKDLIRSGSSMRILALRYFNPVGAHPSGLIGELPIGKPNNLIPFLTQTAIGKQEQLAIFGKDYPTPDGTCIRDYIHVCDLADAHVKGIDYLMTKNNNFIDFINVGTGKGTSVLEVVQLFQKIEPDRLKYVFAPPRPGDVIEIYANTEKANRLLNWKTKFTIQDALEHAWNWEQNLLKNA